MGYPFRVILLTDGMEVSRSNSPAIEVARKVAHWHCIKNPGNTAQIVTFESGLVEHFRTMDGAVLNEETGDMIDECPGCRELRGVVVGLEIDLRSANARELKLRQEKKEDVKSSEHWVPIAGLWEYYRERTGRKKARFSEDRFECALPVYLRNGVELCMLAIDGIAFDPNTKERKNGTIEVFNDWELLFRNQGTFERYAKRAPMDKIRAYNERNKNGKHQD